MGLIPRIPLSRDRLGWSGAICLARRRVDKHRAASTWQRCWPRGLPIAVPLRRGAGSPASTLSAEASAKVEPGETDAGRRGVRSPPTKNNLVNGGVNLGGASAWTACCGLRSRPPLSLSSGSDWRRDYQSREVVSRAVVCGTNGRTSIFQRGGLTTPPTKNNLVNGGVSPGGASAWTACCGLRSRPPLSLQRDAAGLSQSTPINLVNGSVSPAVRVRGLRAAGSTPVHHYLYGGALLA